MSIVRLFSAILLISLLGCQAAEEAAGPKIFGNLYVRYLQEGNHIKAEASFFEGDSAHLAQPITIPGGVSFLGSGMESRNIQGKLIRYQYENTTDYPGELSFKVLDENGKVHQFAAKMPPVADFLIPDTISKARGIVLELQPAPASPNEQLALLFSDAEGKASLVEIPPPIGQKVPISPAQLKKLGSGPHQLYLVKKQNTFIQQEAYRVDFEVEFYTVVKNVVIGD